MTRSASLPEPAGSTDARLAELIDELTAQLQAGGPIDQSCEAGQACGIHLRMVFAPSGLLEERAQLARCEVLEHL